MRGRYAPSPTGPMHLGNARTALCAWLQVRKAGGQLVLRVEDLDRDRVKPGAEAALLADLRWLGLDWDEGPDVGGPHGPYRQSERLDRYEAALERLRADGLIYACTCSRAEIRAAARAAPSAPHGPADDGPVYPGTCRQGTSSRREQAALRFRVDAPAEVSFVDQLAGPQTQDVAREVGDFVVRRADGVFAYQLAVVVDDAAMGIDEVLRGDDLIRSTPRQLLLFRALGARAPRYAHVPLIVGPDGVRLSKRHGAVGLAELRARGVTAGQLRGWLGASLALCPPGEQPSMRELLAAFSLERLPRRPAVLTDLGPLWDS